MEFADRHGIVVIDEAGAVGLNLRDRRRHLRRTRPSPTFAPENINDDTRATHAQAIRELIARDKNHPSVVMWSIANEPASNEDGRARVLRAARGPHPRARPDPPGDLRERHVLDTTRTTCIADLFDVICLNRYYGWYVDSGDLAAAEQKLEAELRGWQQKFARPLIMTEYGADTVAGYHSIYDTPLTEEYQTSFLDMYHRVFDRVEAMVGEQVWNFADFQTKNGIARVDGNKKGVFTRDRKPKAAAHALRARWTGLKK